MKTKIENFLERFPKNATCWSDATDEIRDLSRTSREYLEELDEVTVEPVDFNACKTPSAWNTKGRASIIANFDKMRPATQERFYNRFREWFDNAEPQKPWAMRLVDGSVLYFDTNEEMVAHSIRPEVAYKRMGKTEYIIND
jgi:hypothetical protein